MNRTEIELAKMLVCPELLKVIYNTNDYEMYVHRVNSYRFTEKLNGVNNLFTKTTDVFNFFAVLSQEVMHEYSVPHEVWLAIFSSLSNRHQRAILKDEQMRWCHEIVQERLQFSNAKVCLWYVARGEISVEEYNARFGGMSFVEFKEWFPTKSSMRSFGTLLNDIKIIL